MSNDNFVNSREMQGPNEDNQFDPLNPWKGLISPGWMKPEDEPLVKPIEYCEDDMLWNSYMANPKFKEEEQPPLEPAKFTPLIPPTLPTNGWQTPGQEFNAPFGITPGKQTPISPLLKNQYREKQANQNQVKKIEPKQQDAKKQELSIDYPQLTEIKPVNQVQPKSLLQVRKLEENYLQPPTDDWFNQLKKLHCSKLLDPQNNTNMKEYLNQQVSYLEPSPIQRKLDDLKRKNQRFIDEAFPANQRSLTGEWGYIKKWKDVRWQRISDIIKNPVIFDHKVEPSDIKQGQLGDCYFLAALSALADRPQRIFSLFLVLQENYQKYYACKILYKGKWKTIDLDEYIPTLNGKPAFSKATGQQLWVILLQKAWAKLYSSYKRIEAGYGEQGIHCLTGAHMHSIRCQESDFDKEASWKYLMRATRKGYCMIASSMAGSDTECFSSGIVKGHAYTFVGVYQVEYQNGIRRLVKLRNPWGKGESIVAWSDKDGRWNYVSPQEKKRIGYERNASDGMFFFLYEDFLKDFRIINIAQVNDNASYVYLVQNPPRKKGCYFKVNIYKQGDYSFQINQTPDRAYEYRHQKSYKYQTITFLIGRVCGNQIQYFQGSQSAYRTLFKKHRLPPGEYVVFAKIYFDERYEMDYEVALAVYGDYVCDIMPCQPQEVGKFKERLFMNRARRMKGKEILPGIWTQQEILREGYIYFACWNRSGQDATLNIAVQKNSNPTVYVKKPFKNMRQIQIPIRHKQDAIILARIPSFTYATQGIGKAKVYMRR